ncbi:hypothetical protein [Carboxylicivirga sp. N1Y90]|uniref:hypothetical protein n=1 Tax=Carboxylicivirga fragile TaxID=3417571 RepID=UPI003D34C0C2|nr:hypothetical protein [Marinilabiliaceae bacterium N1Y90]
MNHCKWLFKPILIVLIFLYSCQKKEYTVPVNVELEVALKNGTSNHLSFDSGTILFKQIFFDGHRTQGGDVHFATKTDDEIGPFQFFFDHPALIENFDIPQGVYSLIEWELTLDEIDDIENDDDDNDEGNNIDNNSKIEDFETEGGLVFNGTYNSLSGHIVPLFIIIDEDEIFKVKTINNDGLQDITISAEKPYLAQIKFDPYYATKTISVESLESSDLSHTDLGAAYIEISSDQNEVLYENILFRLQNSVKIIIN